MKSFIFILSFLININLILSGQLIFQRTFLNSNDDSFSDIELSSGGEIYLCGRTYSDQTGEDVFLIKTNISGEIIWSKTFGTIWNDRGLRINELQDNSLIIAGASKINDQDEFNNYILRISQNGDVIWSTNFGGDLWDYPYSKPIQNVEGDIYILGSTESFGTGGKDICLTKLSLDGEILWSKYYGTEFGFHDWGKDLTILPDGNLIITSVINEHELITEGCFIKVNTIGEILWTKSLVNGNRCHIYKSAVNNSGEILCVGRIINPGDYEYDAFIVKLVDNEVVWSKSFGDYYLDYATSVSFDYEGNHLITGFTNNYGFGYSDIFLINISDEGFLEWGKLFGGQNHDVSGAGSVIATSVEGYYLASSTSSFNSSFEEFYLIKTDTSGISGCNEMDFSPELEEVSISTESPVLLTGDIYYQSASTQENVNLVQPQSEIICIDTITNTNYYYSPMSMQCYVYPNPSDKVITVFFGKFITIGSLLLYNDKGVKIEKYNIINQHCLTLNVKNLNSGVYLVKLSDFEYTSTKSIKFLKR